MSKQIKVIMGDSAFHSKKVKCFTCGGASKSTMLCNVIVDIKDTNNNWFDEEYFEHICIACRTKLDTTEKIQLMCEMKYLL